MFVFFGGNREKLAFGSIFTLHLIDECVLFRFTEFYWVSVNGSIQKDRFVFQFFFILPSFMGSY